MVLYSMNALPSPASPQVNTEQFTKYNDRTESKWKAAVRFPSLVQWMLVMPRAAASAAGVPVTLLKPVGAKQTT